MSIRAKYSLKGSVSRYFNDLVHGRCSAIFDASISSVLVAKYFMAKFPEMTKWLKVDVNRTSDDTYEHVLADEVNGNRAATLPGLKAVVAAAHADARERLQKLVCGNLDPLGAADGVPLADGYPQRLNIQTLKGYFGEVCAGLVAENLHPFGMKDWQVPAYLFRYHVVAFQQLAMIKQSGDDAGLIPGRTGDDCLAFRRNKKGEISATLFCEGKCSADHDAGMINDAHEKSSMPNPLPVDLLQIIGVLEDSADPEAAGWVDALRRLNLGKKSDEYERFDQVTYVCGRKPVMKGRKTWITSDKPHTSYKGGRKLQVAEIHLSDVEKLISEVYGAGRTA